MAATEKLQLAKGGGSMSEALDPPVLADPDSLTAEERRLREARAGIPWRAWGP